LKKKSFILIAFFILHTFAFANNPYILKHDGLIDQRAQDKIFQIGQEVKSKLNVNLYAYITENNGIDITLPREERIVLMKQFEKDMVKDLPKPYAIVAISTDQLYTNILMSEDLKDILDKDDLLDGYVIPLLASKDKNTLFAKTSAAVLNGYAQMADSIAASQNIELLSSIGSGGKVASTIWKMVMYTLVLGGIILYAIIIMRERKYKKEAQKNGK
jgi:hypothetical protein